MSFDLKPHFDNVASAARLSGHVHGLHTALQVMVAHGRFGTPEYKEVYERLMAATEADAARVLPATFDEVLPPVRRGPELVVSNPPADCQGEKP